MRISDWSSDVCSSDLVVERDKYGVEHTVQRTEQRQWVFFPKTLDVGGTVGPKIRRSGLYEVRVYEWRGHAQAEFDVRIPADEDPARGRSIGTPWLGYAIGDVRGLRGKPDRKSTRLNSSH